MVSGRWRSDGSNFSASSAHLNVLQKLCHNFNSPCFWLLQPYETVLENPPSERKLEHHQANLLTSHFKNAKIYEIWKWIYENMKCFLVMRDNWPICTFILPLSTHKLHRLLIQSKGKHTRMWIKTLQKATSYCNNPVLPCNRSRL